MSVVNAAHVDDLERLAPFRVLSLLLVLSIALYHVADGPDSQKLRRSRKVMGTDRCA